MTHEENKIYSYSFIYICDTQRNIYVGKNWEITCNAISSLTHTVFIQVNKFRSIYNLLRKSTLLHKILLLMKKKQCFQDANFNLNNLHRFHQTMAYAEDCYKWNAFWRFIIFDILSSPYSNCEGWSIKSKRLSSEELLGDSLLRLRFL